MNAEFIIKYNYKKSKSGYSVIEEKLRKIHFSSWMKYDKLIYNAMVIDSRTFEYNQSLINA